MTLPKPVLLFAVVLAASSARAVEFGWQNLPEGGIEYLLQVEPELIDSFRQTGFSSEVPPGLRDVRRIRISVGRGPLPNQGDITGPEIAGALTRSSPSASTAREPSTMPTTEAPLPQLPPADVDTPHLAEPSPPPLLDPSDAAMPLATPAPTQSPPEGFRSNSDDRPPAPRLSADDGPRATGAEMTSSGETFGAAQPETAAFRPADSTPRADATDAALPAGKPWTALMLCLVGLFASLGANVYLVWIHQGLRANYHALLRSMQKTPASRATIAMRDIG